MRDGSQYVQYRPIRAPRADHSVLVEPPLEDARGMVDENVRRRQAYHYDFQGRSLAELSRQARRELLGEACRWTCGYRDVDRGAIGADRLLFLAGHQPQLFHPGVWFKNFAMGHLARQVGAVAVNLVVDSDTMKGHTLRVPGGSPQTPQVTAIPLDRPGPAIPYEERRILDPQVLAQFGAKAAEQIAPLVADPLVRQLWPLVRQRMEHTDRLGDVLAQSRHMLEGQWGIQTLEVPQSRVCEMESFAWFACHLLTQLPRFQQDYNSLVSEYRHAHGIRSRAHPVPDLAVEDDWLEAPFWVWTQADPQRRRLFACRKAGQLRLSDLQHWEVRLPLDDRSDLGPAAARFHELAAEGIKIRSRALVTTLWARLVLGDLFFHGIGGAKYDQLTDGLIARFFGLQPPGFLYLSATLFLPIPHRRTSDEDVRFIQQRLRDLTWHPERFVDGAPPHESTGEGPHALIAEKRHWVLTPKTRENAAERHRAIRRANEALEPWVADQRRQWAARLQATLSARRAEAILSSREYSFCLYPAKELRAFLFGSLLPRS